MSVTLGSQYLLVHFTEPIEKHLILTLAKKNWPRFSLPKFTRSSIYVITIVKFSNRSIQNLLNFPQRTSMDFYKVSLIIYLFLTFDKQYIK